MNDSQEIATVMSLSSRYYSAILLLVGLFFLLGVAPTPGQAQSIPIPLSPERWVIGEKNEKLRTNQRRENNGKVVDYLGRPALHLAKAFAYVRDLDFQNGTIDADVAADPEGFQGVAFRVESEDDYELFFFRPGASGDVQAIQYTPGLLGANAWQIYNLPDYVAAADIPQNQWFHVRIVVAGLVAKLYFNNSAEPTLVVPDLKRGYSKGSIGFWGHQGGGYFSNVSYTPDSSEYQHQEEKKFLPGTLTDWQLSESFDVTDKDPGVYPDTKRLHWERVEAENPGMVVIQRYRRDPNVVPPQGPGSKVVFARTMIHADLDENRKMSFGYSDKVVIYVNAKPVYAGNNIIGSREPHFLGVMNVNNDSVYLPLKKGDNELVLAVSEYFGGWGFICQWSK